MIRLRHSSSSDRTTSAAPQGWEEETRAEEAKSQRRSADLIRQEEVDQEEEGETSAFLLPSAESVQLLKSPIPTNRPVKWKFGCSRFQLLEFWSDLLFLFLTYHSVSGVSSDEPFATLMRVE
ncbi:unnamed protein product [Linum trigynum]|uniref:Uncharacterized protein n=1 Tax=Linum trigynum TaxID=586398 RepID=A0AAV2EFP1_9ROSI